MDVAPDADARRVVLIGLRGCGKTTLGRELARRLARPFSSSKSSASMLPEMSTASMTSTRS